MDKQFKVNNFDLLRLFSALEVLVLHSYPRLNIPYPAFFNVISYFPGVSMFFVMSGFLISASLERNRDLKNYFKNRALRIFPGLWACIIVTIFVISIVGRISFFNLQTLPWLLAQFIGIIYTPAFLSGFGFGSYNGSLWTIPLELQFYVCLPVIYFITSKLAKNERRKTWIITIIFVFFCAITFYIKGNFARHGNEIETLTQKIIRYSFIPSIFFFLFGVVMQRFKIYQSNIVHGKGLFWLIIYLAVSYFVPTTDTTYVFKLLFLGFTTISLAYTFTKASNILRGNDISYGVYIYHGLVLGAFVQLKLFANPIYILLLLFITIVLAVLSWYFIEKPFMKKKIVTIHKVD